MDVLSITPIRAEILRDLAVNPDGSTAVEIAERVGADYRSVWAHLKTLSSKGVVAVERPNGRRNGPIYRLDQDVLEAHFSAALRYVTGR